VADEKLTLSVTLLDSAPPPVRPVPAVTVRLSGTYPERTIGTSTTLSMRPLALT
jgi:hypothetical protein